MCIREDIGKENFGIFEGEKDDEFTVTLKIEANSEILVRIKAFTSLPPSYTECLPNSSLADSNNVGKLISPKYNQYWFNLNPWVQRACSVQDIDSDGVIKIFSHTLRSGENFYIARRIKSLCDVPR